MEIEKEIVEVFEQAQRPHKKKQIKDWDDQILDFD